MRKSGLQFLERNFELFRENFDESKSSFSEKSIHDYRVALKRIFTLFMVQCNSEESKACKNVERLRWIFKKGGAVRDIQVMLILINELELIENQNESFVIYLQSKLDVLTASFQSFTKRTKTPSKSGFMKEAKQLMHIQLSECNILQLMKVNHQRAERLYAIEIEADYLHTIRTLIKRNYFLMEIQQDNNESIEFQLYKERLRQIEKEIGVWHDWFNLEKSAIRFFAHHPSDNMDLLFTINSKRLALEQKVIQTLETFFETK